MSMAPDEIDVKLHELKQLSDELNKSIGEYNDICKQMQDHQINMLRPFGLENNDGDAAMESLMGAAANVLRKIVNFIIKLWTGLKELLDKVLHIFDRSKKKLQALQEKFKNGIKVDNEEAFLAGKVTAYGKVLMFNRIHVLLREINMRWTELDGTPNMVERKSLAEIGFTVTVTDGKVTASYKGIYPKLDTVGGHGYRVNDVGELVNKALELLEKFPGYKENMIKSYDNNITARYKRDTTSEMRKQTILADRAAYMAIHKTFQFVIKDIREIAKEVIAICNLIP